MERRQFIAGSAIAALSVSALPIAAATAGTNRSQWEAALRRYEKALADAERYDREVYYPLADRLDRIEDAAGLDRARFGFWERRKAFVEGNPKLYHDYHAVSDEVSRLGDAVADAQCALMGVPAPDLAALRFKLEQFREGDELGPYTGAFVGQTYEDLARLIPHGH